MRGKKKVFITEDEYQVLLECAGIVRTMAHREFQFPNLRLRETVVRLDEAQGGSRAQVRTADEQG